MRRLRFVITLLLSGCVTTPPPPAPPHAIARPGFVSNCAIDPGLAAEQAVLLAEINRERRAHGLRPVATAQRLGLAAQDYACITAQRNVLDHRGPDGTRAGDRAARAGYAFRLVGENLGLGFHHAREAMFYWMRSPSHRNNVLTPQMTEAALGLAQTANGRRAWVLLLGHPR